jgi:hypothetical protein
MPPGMTKILSKQVVNTKQLTVNVLGRQLSVAQGSARFLSKASLFRAQRRMQRFTPEIRRESLNLALEWITKAPDAA